MQCKNISCLNISIVVRIYKKLKDRNNPNFDSVIWRVPVAGRCFQNVYVFEFYFTLNNIKWVSEVCITAMGSSALAAGIRLVILLIK